MVAPFKDDALELDAAADGEVVLLRRNATGLFVDCGEVIALLEAKKRFKLVREGRPVITDDVFGQMVAEALALRLSLAPTELGIGEETIIVVMATRQYICFISLHIPDAYVQKLRVPNGPSLEKQTSYYGEEEGMGRDVDESEDTDEMEQDFDDGGDEWEEDEFITVHSTDCLDLSTPRCRQLACDNITALVDWQLGLHQYL